MDSKNNFKKKFVTSIEKPNRIIITTHYSPDDDAIGSSLALYDWLTTKYPQKNINVVITGTAANRYTSFFNFNQIKFVADLSSELTGIDALIMLDGSQYSRFTRSPLSIVNGEFKKICLDHHSSPIDKFDLIYLDKKATSTSEIVMDVVYGKGKISPKVAEVLLLGIFGDTGTFNYLKPNQLNTFDNVKKLLKIANIEIQDFKAKYATISHSVFTIIQEYMRNTKFVDLPSGENYQYSFVTKEFLDKNDFSDGQASEACHVYMAEYLRLIEGYRWGFVATPKKTEISVSFRSLPGSVNVRSLVERLDIGGGHDRAAGSGFKPERWGKKLSLNFTLKYLINWIGENELELS
ncbi:MAG: DHH family phosphoesterase [Candidatus Shapirobacteria bacterium]